MFANLRDYEDIFEISPPAAQGSATATLLVRNSSALDYDRGLREYTLEVSILFQMGIVLYCTRSADVRFNLFYVYLANRNFYPSHADIALVFGHSYEKDIFLATFKIKKGNI